MRTGARRALIAGGAVAVVVVAWVVAGPPPVAGESGTGSTTVAGAGRPSPTGSELGVEATSSASAASSSPSATVPPADLLPLHGLCSLVSARAISSLVGVSLQSFDDLPHGLDQCSLKDEASGWSVTYELTYMFPFEGSPADGVRTARAALDPTVKASDLGLGDASFRADSTYSGFAEETATQVAVGQFAVAVRVLAPVDASSGAVAMSLTSTLTDDAAHAVQVGWSPPGDWVAVAAGWSQPADAGAVQGS